MRGGFSPHRDRQPQDVKGSFRADGSPKYATCWISLDEAHPSNSCLYVIPRGSDPGYVDGDVDECDPLARALPTKHAYQQIRAIPLKQGEAVMFTHRILHWGSGVDQDYTGSPRLSLSFAASDDSFEEPYFDRKYLPLPPPWLRLALCCAQMIVYYQRFDTTLPALTRMYSYFKTKVGGGAVAFWVACMLSTVGCLFRCDAPHM